MIELLSLATLLMELYSYFSFFKKIIISQELEKNVVYFNKKIDCSDI